MSLTSQALAVPPTQSGLTFQYFTNVDFQKISVPPPGRNCSTPPPPLSGISD